MTTKTITVEKSFGDKSVSKSGSCQVVETADDVLTMLQEDSSAPVPKDASESETKRIRGRVISFLNYALDLKCRASLTSKLNSENVDPEKAAEKMLEGLNKWRIAQGLPALATVEEAKKLAGAA